MPYNKFYLRKPVEMHWYQNSPALLFNVTTSLSWDWVIWVPAVIAVSPLPVVTMVGQYLTIES